VPSWVAPTRVRRAPPALPAPQLGHVRMNLKPRLGRVIKRLFIEQLLRVLRRGASACRLLVECGVDSTVGAAQDRDHRDVAPVASLLTVSLQADHGGRFRHW
jgi:hypothetical protein